MTAAAETTASDIPATQAPAASSSETLTRGRWTLFNIAVIIVSFVVFWPLGLFLLVWIFMDRELRELPEIVQSLFSRLRGWMSRQNLSVRTTNSGNRVFDEFQQTQFDRIDEIKMEINERDNAYRDFKDEQDRAMEQQLFETFMQKKPAAGGEAASE